MVLPVGQSKLIEKINPPIKLTMDMITAYTRVDLKLLENCIAMTVGKMMRL
jgi:hypothetical protein